MASLRMKSFQVRVFLSVLGVVPDFLGESVALTEVSAIGHVMRRCLINEAAVVSIADWEGRERWLYGVRLVDSELLYERVA
jgi:hypothetical protein